MIWCGGGGKNYMKIICLVYNDTNNTMNKVHVATTEIGPQQLLKQKTKHVWRSTVSYTHLTLPTILRV